MSGQTVRTSCKRTREQEISDEWPTEFLFCDHWDMAVLGQILAGEVTGGYGRLREVTEEENGGNGGKWRNSEAQRRAASVGVRNKIVCKGMRSYTEEGGGEGVQSKEKSSKGAADGLGFCSYGIVRGCLG